MTHLKYVFDIGARKKVFWHLSDTSAAVPSFLYDCLPNECIWVCMIFIAILQNITNGVEFYQQLGILEMANYFTFRIRGIH